MHVFCWAGFGKLMFKPWLGLYSWAFGLYTLLFDLALLSHWRAMTTVRAQRARRGNRKNVIEERGRNCAHAASD
jgi:hypothetical protein